MSDCARVCQCLSVLRWGERKNKWGRAGRDRRKGRWKRGGTQVMEGQGGGGGEGYKMVQLQAKHYFSLVNKRFHGGGQCLVKTAECC